jgi:DNA invertase Pin-like site-specific DNA recombinase
MDEGFTLVFERLDRIESELAELHRGIHALMIRQRSIESILSEIRKQVVPAVVPAESE